MLTPEQLIDIPQNIIELSRELELELLKDIGDRLRVLEPNLRSPTIDWKLKKIKEMTLYDKFIKQKLQEFSGRGIAEIETLLNNALENSLKTDNVLFVKTDTKFVYALNNDNFLKVLNTAKKLATNDFKNMSKTLAFNGQIPKEFYNKTLDYAHLKLKSGAYSISEVVRDTAQKVRASGLQTVDYESGYRVNIETAVRRNIMGTLNNSTDEMSQRNAKALDTDMFEVSAHFNARPDHAIWQGKVYTSEQLISVCGHGTGAGLEGWNCRHQKFPYIKGVSRRVYTDEELKTLHTPDFTYDGVKYTGYEATQRQRQIESRIRALQRSYAVMQDKATRKLIQQDKRLYNDFSDKAGLKLQKERFVA